MIGNPPPADIKNELISATWRKSTYSDAGGECIEVARLTNDRIALRDSKDPHGPVLIFSGAEWRQFTTGLARG
ncbi:DUF397 domain-containing protein [Spongiactinospora rosea]|uniref:DUF397 domain-containing protein n=1 Tax=Spongiactinospora rosea TaxID=2248750 RepID=A0A366M9H3_9ACTN|nr:DUF397 domain-containing protein [Spongiactinospora rosea]RBQ22132.1 DUF397 domain-containing protein [Spongiactinospora rosea]